MQVDRWDANQNLEQDRVNKVGSINLGLGVGIYFFCVHLTTSPLAQDLHVKVRSQHGQCLFCGGSMATQRTSSTYSSSCTLWNHLSLHAQTSRAEYHGSHWRGVRFVTGGLMGSLDAIVLFLVYNLCSNQG